MANFSDQGWARGKKVTEVAILLRDFPLPLPSWPVELPLKALHVGQVPTGKPAFRRFYFATRIGSEGLVDRNVAASKLVKLGVVRDHRHQCRGVQMHGLFNTRGREGMGCSLPACPR
jgi:hypothetical protein